MKRRWIWMLALGALGGCKAGKATSPVATALAFLDGARGSGIGPELVDDVMIGRVRRAQRLHSAAHANLPPEKLAEVWTTDPDGSQAAAERSKRVRERAEQAIKRSLHGPCEGAADETARKQRVDAITAPVPNAPADAASELGKLAGELAAAQLVKVTCEDGAAGMLLVSRGAGWAVVDVFPLGGLHMPMPGAPAKAP